MQVHPIVNNKRAPLTIPSSYIWVRAAVGECSKGQTDTQTAVTTIHVASSVPHVKCNYQLSRNCKHATDTIKTGAGGNQCCDPLVCLSHAPSSTQSTLEPRFYRTPIRNPTLEVATTGQCGHMVTRSGKNVLVSEKFTSSISRKQREIDPRLLLNTNRKSQALIVSIAQSSETTKNDSLNLYQHIVSPSSRQYLVKLQNETRALLAEVLVPVSVIPSPAACVASYESCRWLARAVPDACLAASCVLSTSSPVAVNTNTNTKQSEFKRVPTTLTQQRAISVHSPC